MYTVPSKREAHVVLLDVLGSRRSQIGFALRVTALVPHTCSICGAAACSLQPRPAARASSARPRSAMPFGTSKHLSHRKRVAKVESAWDADEASSTAVAAAGPERPRSMSADERYTLFAHLAWLSCYPAIFAVERAADGASLTYDLSTRFASAATRRAVSSAPDGPQARKLFERLGDAAGMLRRSANVQFVPFAQAVKAVAFLAAMVPKTIWAAERRARRVVGRAWAMTLLGVMVDLRPPPPFETHDCVRAVVVDQTYARTGGCGTGSSKYRAVEALNADGERRKEERLVYMNGLERALPAFPLSDEARERLADWGPYTQSFDRVVPVLQPSRIELVKDDLLRRSLALLAGGAPGGVGGVGGGARVGTSIEQVRTAYCLLLTAYCLLPTSYCVLPTSKS